MRQRIVKTKLVLVRSSDPAINAQIQASITPEQRAHWHEVNSLLYERRKNHRRRESGKPITPTQRAGESKEDWAERKWAELVAKVKQSEARQ